MSLFEILLIFLPWILIRFLLLTKESSWQDTLLGFLSDVTIACEFLFTISLIGFNAHFVAFLAATSSLLILADGVFVFHLGRRLKLSATTKFKEFILNESFISEGSIYAFLSCVILYLSNYFLLMRFLSPPPLSLLFSLSSLALFIIFSSITLGLYYRPRWASNVKMNFFFLLQQQLWNYIKKNDTAQAPPIPENLLQNEDYRPLHPNFPLYRKTLGFSGEKQFHVQINSYEKPHIIFVALESCRADLLRFHGNQDNVTPTLDRLVNESIFFSNAYSSGLYTLDAVISTIFGIPPNFDHEVAVWQAKNFVNMPLIGLPDILKQYGYEEALIQSSSLDFNLQRLILDDKKFRNLLGSKELVKTVPGLKNASGWGIDDSKLFDYAYNWLITRKTPTFLSLFTIASHHPFRTPTDYNLSQFEKTQCPLPVNYLKCIHYIDHHLGEFMKRIKDSPIGKNCVFFIFGDHGITFEKNGKLALNPQLDEKRFHVPLLIHAPHYIKDPITVNEYASHVDLIPTVIDMLGITGTHHSFGKSLMRKPQVNDVYLNNASAGTFFGIKQDSLKYTLELVENGTTKEKFDSFDKQKETPLRDKIHKYQKLIAYLYGYRHFAPGEQVVLDFSDNPDLEFKQLKKQIQRHPEAKTVNLSHCLKIRSLPKLPASLEHLDLTNLVVQDDAIDLVRKNCPNLKRLVLSHCLLLTDHSLLTLSTGSLDELYLHHIHDFTEGGLLSLSPLIEKLSSLGMKEITSLTDRVLASWQAPHLRLLSISCQNITDKGLIAFLQKAPKLEELTLYQADHLTDKCLEELSKLPITVLGIYGNRQFTDEGFSYLKTTPIRQLSFDPAPNMTRESLRSWEQMPLVSLRISGADQIDDSALSYVSALPVQRLHISKAPLITEQGVLGLHSPFLEQLHFSDCQQLKKRTEEKTFKLYGNVERVLSIIVSSPFNEP